MKTNTKLLTIAALAGGLSILTACKEEKTEVRQQPADPNRTDVHIHDDRPAADRVEKREEYREYRSTDSNTDKNIHVEHADNVRQ